eukprot:3536658-Rhodomonas_salina.2
MTSGISHPACFMRLRSFLTHSQSTPIRRMRGLDISSQMCATELSGWSRQDRKILQRVRLSDWVAAAEREAGESAKVRCGVQRKLGEKKVVLRTIWVVS